MRRIVSASLVALMVAAGPVSAQPPATGTTPAPAPPAPPSPPPPPSNPPVVTTPPPETTTPPESPPESPPVNQPVQQAAPPPPAQIELSPTEPYPNGLADPVNFASADNDRGGGGFPWGLLGLLGLLGLIPWLRGGPKTIYVEREKPGQDPTRPLP